MVPTGGPPFDGSDAWAAQPGCVGIQCTPLLEPVDYMLHNPINIHLARALDGNSVSCIANVPAECHEWG